MRTPRGRRALIVLAIAATLGACVVFEDAPNPARNVWWRGHGPVLPHETFPADCALCHVGKEWRSLSPEFQFDHEAETGVALTGAHQRAKCLRCHNDRGPVDAFQAQGCVGCHEDFHQGFQGTNCVECHTENSWRPFGQHELHNRTRFPLTGVHQSTSCRRCHPGFEVGRFAFTDVECITCHRSDLARALNPNHVGLGWVDNCDRCHQPTDWNQAEINN